MPTLAFMIAELTKLFRLSADQVDQLHGKDRFTVYKLYIANCTDHGELD